MINTNHINTKFFDKTRPSIFEEYKPSFKHIHFSKHELSVRGGCYYFETYFIFNRYKFFQQLPFPKYNGFRTVFLGSFNNFKY